MPTHLLAILLIALAALAAGPLHAQGTTQAVDDPFDRTVTTAAQRAIGPPSPWSNPAGGNRSPLVSIDLGRDEATNLNTGLELFLLMTMLSFAPAIVMTMTCFPRILIVLSFMKRAVGIQEMPPSLVVTGFAVFLTLFVMMPVLERIHDNAYAPYAAEEIGFETAARRAGAEMTTFMLRQTREEDIALVLELSDSPPPDTPADLAFHVVVPAFVLSEIKTAFQMGFVLFLPFIVIDLVISSILISMGMFTLPPVVVSTPLKLLLFILVDGWNLVVESLVTSLRT